LAPAWASRVAASARTCRGSGQRFSRASVASSMAMTAALGGDAIGPRSRNRQLSVWP